MKGHAWWFGLDDEDDKKWYRKHISMEQSKLTWLSDKRQEADELTLLDLQEDTGVKEKDSRLDNLTEQLQSFSELEKTILLLRWGKGEKWKDIAKATGKSMGYLCRIGQVAFAKLQKRMKGDLNSA
tara:strand:+ start:310 stop:687 length:378 start_codon:yes stop_codon:yes gene_type:complete